MMVDMKGFVEYEDKQYPFSFSDSTLNLYPDKFDSKSIEEWFAPYERGEVIENIQLHGITANRKNVIFEVSEQYSDQEGFLSFDVYSIFEYDSARYKPYIEDGKHKYNVKKTKISEYSRAMKSHFRKFGNQMSGSGNHLCNYASLLA